MAATHRTPLTRERVVLGAVAVADATGVASLTIRALATHLSVKPMAIYHHVSTKDEILDGIVDHVFSEIELPVPGRDWREQMHRRSTSAREVLGRHPWAISLMDSRASPGPHTLAQLDAVIGTLRAGGFSVPMAAHGIALLDAYVYGFALQEATLPITGPDDIAGLAEALVDQMADGSHPHLLELTTDHVLRPGYDFADEFGFGLELLLDGLARAASARL